MNTKLSESGRDYIAHQGGARQIYLRRRAALKKIIAEFRNSTLKSMAPSYLRDIKNFRNAMLYYRELKNLGY